MKTFSRSSSKKSLVEPKTTHRRLPQILKVLRCTGGKLIPNVVITLPSNMKFRMANYFKLLEAQRLEKESEHSQAFRESENSDRENKDQTSQGTTNDQVPKIEGEVAEFLLNCEIEIDSTESSTNKAKLLASFDRKEILNITTILPSDKAWRMKNYFKLLEEQKSKGKNAPLETKKTTSVDWQAEVPQQPEAKRPRRSKVAQSQALWLAKDIVKAAQLLRSQDHSLDFEDEEEMRRVFTLLYDVFRYKTVLKEALDETGFTDGHPEYKDMIPLVWLLFYDLHKRRFLPREHEDEAICRSAFEPIGLSIIEYELWDYRVRLAAALARNRIKNSALRLNSLLPNHLRDERLLSVEQAPATGWINSFLIGKTELLDSIPELGLRLSTAEEVPNFEQTAKFDHVCPKVISIPASFRPLVARSNLVKSGHLILQDRTFCLGPTILDQILKDLSLRGSVVQSHIISPRATAYLATILLDNEKIDKIFAFGSGDRMEEYQKYLDSLGIKNCEVKAERWNEIPPDSPMLENVMAVLATPPTSWTGVADPVDLVCSRSGDMTMLRTLTQTRRGRDSILLEEQKNTLRYSMSLPQVQVVVYESHSVSLEENTGMVHSAVNCMNEWARQKHAEEQRIIQEHEEAEERLNKSMLPGGTPAQREQREREALEAQEALAAPLNVQVPPCDLFDITPLPDLCIHGPDCATEEGCFIARIQRKEVISLDAKYMIKIAEARGLFGSESAQKKASALRAQKKREEIQRSSSDSDKCKIRRTKIEMDRIAAHTHASLTRYSSSDILSCERYNTHVQISRKRRIALRKLLIRTWWHLTYNLVRRYIPYWQMTPRGKAAAVLPILRLPRSIRRKPFPLHRIDLPVDLVSEPGEITATGLSSICEQRRNSY